MSELINNREYRRKILKEMISDLHKGKKVEDVKKRFEDTFEGVSAAEISEVEQALIMDGMPVTEVQRLCDVHAAVFKGSIEEIHAPRDPSKEPGHPVDIFRRENRALEQLLKDSFTPDIDACDAGVDEDLERLWQIDKHYAKKENILFPYLEAHGITAPPKVMWGVDDEVRDLIKAAKAAREEGDCETLREKAAAVSEKITEMIFKEENILFPMLLENLTEDEWKKASADMAEFGYCLIDDVPQWAPAVNASASAMGPDATAAANAAPAAAATTPDGYMTLPSGVLKLGEMIAMLDALPFDVTFVDKDDTVKYFTQGKDRIFARTKSIIGRKVTNCHPPASVHIVEQIVADLKSGAKDHEDFWIKMGDRFVYIRYFAVRSETGEFLGTMEVTQDVAPIRALTGEKRLMS